MFSLCCPLYGLEMVPGKPCPVEEMAGSIAASIITTMSVCSGDMGYSRKMGSDVTREEQDQITHWLGKDAANTSSPDIKRNSRRDGGKDSLDRSGDGSLTPTLGKFL